LPITEIACGKKVRWIALKIINHEAKIVEVGFILKSNVHRKGIISHAFELLQKYAFNELNLNKLVAFYSVNNTASYKVLEKLGFAREGCFIEHTLINHQYVDIYAYGLCKSALKCIETDKV
jgi:ribosomal-protein-alanine N-acetyltransferase